MKTFARVFAVAAVLGPLSGCGGSAVDVGERAPRSATFDSTLTDDVELGSFDAEESQRFCTERAEWELARAKENLPDICRDYAAFSARLFYSPSESLADVKQTCQSTYDACVAGTTLTRRDCSKRAYSKGCHATVAEAEACSSELMQQEQHENESAVECSELKARDLELKPNVAEEPEPTLGPACSTVLFECPMYFDP